MKNILVPTDFSDCALNALKFAAELAKKDNATVHLAHIYQRVISNDTAFNIELEADIITKEKENFETYVHSLSEEDYLKGVKIESSIVSVYKLWDILVMDRYEDIDMIVMGSNGVDGVQELFVGTNAQKFVQLAECPVIVIKDQTKIADIKSIVFTSDFKKEVIPRFKVIQKFANSIGAKLHFLKIRVPKDYIREEEEMAEIAHFVRETGVDSNEVSVYQSVSVERGIIKFCEDMDAGMVAIETHGRTGLGHLIHDNIAESLANHSVIPLFSVKIQQDQDTLTSAVAHFLSDKNLIAKIV
tara:strand:- start:232 stop:1131 length:900 start_codon:yes stop_codon:yes gene_type:complete